MLTRRRFLLALPMLLLGAWPGEASARRRQTPLRVFSSPSRTFRLRYRDWHRVGPG